MGVSASPFWIFSDLLALTPLIYLIRLIAPEASVFRAVVALVGLYVLFLVGPRFVLFFVAYWFVVWLLQKAMHAFATSGASILNRLATAAVILTALAPMVVWKVVPEVFQAGMNRGFAIMFWDIFPALGPSDALFGFIIPLGLSFAVFRALDLLIKVRLQLLEPISLGRVYYFGLFPPILVLGPISEYEEVRVETRRSRLPDPGDVAVGAFRIGVGAIKIFVFSYYLESYATGLWASGKALWWQAWVAVFVFAVHFYLNFSGYSDLAIGLARLWGLKLKENFDNPFFKTNPQAFWASWHMSLTRWVQRYVFVPLGGMRRNRQYFAIFTTIMVIALWHGLEWPLVVFGLYHATIATGHRWLDEYQRRHGIAKRTGPLVDGIKMFCVFAYVALSIPLFYLNTSEVPVFYRTLLPF